MDDAYDWGRIAACNALSDVYAMGGRPAWALNLVGWPRETLPLSLLADVLRGGADAAAGAGTVIVGGHTVDDPEPKYGMCVVGFVDPERAMRLDGAVPGDVLILTKPIGTGIVTTALKRDMAPSGAVDSAVDSMTTLNAAAAEAFVREGVRACTDVTGFGLLGHLHRMMKASGTAATIEAGAVPLLPHAAELAEAGAVPGGTSRNLEAVRPHLRLGEVPRSVEVLLADAQTSGGLLGACPEDVAQGLAARGVGSLIGRIVEGPPGTIEVDA